MADVRVVGGGSDGHPRGDGELDGDRRVERRRSAGPADTAEDILSRLPAVVLLERIPVPTLAIARDGVILFANTAFTDMVGYPPDSLAGLSFPEIFRTVPATLSALSSVHALANLVVELRHHEGWTVRSRMSKSALMRRDDPVVLVTFDNLTEKLWMDEQQSGW